MQNHLRTHLPTLYGASRTSCVVPFESLLKDNPELYLGDLTQLPKEMGLTAEGHLSVSGAVTWQEARAYLRSKGRDIKTSPTEELAIVTAGVATSATGERSFGHGGVREQLVSLEYWDGEGNLQELKAGSTLKGHRAFQNIQRELEEYQESYIPYRDFKNAPFPRLEKETDLMAGMEGQLGVIKSVVLETCPLEERIYLAVWLPSWEVDDRPHLELFAKVQAFRGKILSCEFMDAACLGFLKEEDRSYLADQAHRHHHDQDGKGDLVFLEIAERFFEEVVEGCLGTLALTSEESFFLMPEKNFHLLRAAVPRGIQEHNSRQGTLKKGTDVQVAFHLFPQLLAHYRKMRAEGERSHLPSLLFGHFGDAHLHFNFLVKNDKLLLGEADKAFRDLYRNVREWKGSPFAEHGVGVLKQQFIYPFYGEPQQKMFGLLKDFFDPHRQFFPQGFLNYHLMRNS